MRKSLCRIYQPVAAPEGPAAARTVAELAIAAGRNGPLGILPVYVYDYHDGGVVFAARSFSQPLENPRASRAARPASSEREPHVLNK